MIYVIFCQKIKIEEEEKGMIEKMIEILKGGEQKKRNSQKNSERGNENGRGTRAKREGGGMMRGVLVVLNGKGKRGKNLMGLDINDSSILWKIFIPLPSPHQPLEEENHSEREMEREMEIGEIEKISNVENQFFFHFYSSFHKKTFLFIFDSITGRKIKESSHPGFLKIIPTPFKLSSSSTFSSTSSTSSTSSSSHLPLFFLLHHSPFEENKSSSNTSSPSYTSSSTSSTSSSTSSTSSSSSSTSSSSTSSSSSSTSSSSTSSSSSSSFFPHKISFFPEEKEALDIISSHLPRLYFHSISPHKITGFFF